METKINNQKNESVNSELPPVPEAKVNKLELNGFVKALFIFHILIGVISIFLNPSPWSFFIHGLFILGSIGMLEKKRWGIFVSYIFWLITLIFNIGVLKYDTLNSDELYIFCYFIGYILFFSGMLCIRKNGYSAWTTIWKNGSLSGIYHKEIEIENDAEETKENDLFNDDINEQEINLNHWQKYWFVYIAILSLIIVTALCFYSVFKYQSL